MKKRNYICTIVLIALRFILVGASLNVIVAWSCAIWSPLHQRTSLPQHDGPGYPEGWAGGPFEELGWWTKEWGFGYAQHILYSARGAEGIFLYWRGCSVPYREAGWPIMSFRSTVLPYRNPETHDLPLKWDLPLGIILKRGIPTDALPESFGSHPARRLPIVPIWLGVVFNSAIFGLFAFGMATVTRITADAWNRHGNSRDEGCLMRSGWGGNE